MNWGRIPAVTGGVNLANVRGRSKRDGLAGQQGPIGSGRTSLTGLPDDETSEASVRSWGLNGLVALRERGGIMVRATIKTSAGASRTIAVRLAKHWPSLLSLRLQPNGFRVPVCVKQTRVFARWF